MAKIVLDPGNIGERADGNKARKGKIEQQVAEERNQPSSTMLDEEEIVKRKSGEFAITKITILVDKILSMKILTVTAPYTNMALIVNIKREMVNPTQAFSKQKENRK